MSRTVLTHLYDIGQNIECIRHLTKRRTFRHFEHDQSLRYAVQYALLIISEATRSLPDELQAREPGVPWQDLIAIGNRLHHEYHRVDNVALWELIHSQLEPLQIAVRRLMDGLGYQQL